MKLDVVLSRFLHIFVIYMNLSAWGRNELNLDGLELRNDQGNLSKREEWGWGAVPPRVTHSRLCSVYYGPPCQPVRPKPGSSA